MTYELPTELSQIPYAPSPPLELKDAVRDFVNIKYDFDRAPESIRRLTFTNFQYGKLHPWDYCRETIPFFDFNLNHPTDDRSLRLAPTEYVIGASDAWDHDSLVKHKGNDAPREAIRKIYQLSSQYLATGKAINIADYTLIENVGLIIAHEGKNRVDTFRKLEIPHIPAIISTQSFHTPNKIVIYKNTNNYIAVLDRTWACHIQHPNISIPLLTSYGVTIEEEWDDSLAPLQESLKEIFKQKKAFNYLEKYTNISIIRDKHQNSNKNKQPRSIFSIFK